MPLRILLQRHRVEYLVGLVWLGQGLNLIKGSFMTGQSQWATLGVVLVIVAARLIWGAVHARGRVRS
jgi:hypothetical protein